MASIPTRGKLVSDNIFHGRKVRHVGKPAEPFAAVGAHGHITTTREDGPLRITPAARGIPAMAHVDWGDFCTWEELSDLIEVGKGR